MIADNILLTGHILDDAERNGRYTVRKNYPYNPALIITSGYRCPELNSRVGGSSRQHTRLVTLPILYLPMVRSKKFYCPLPEYLQDKDLFPTILEREIY